MGVGVNLGVSTPNLAYEEYKWVRLSDETIKFEVPCHRRHFRHNTIKISLCSETKRKNEISRSGHFTGTDKGGSDTCIYTCIRLFLN